MLQSEHSTFIIAEAGVNHNGYTEMAHEMIDVAVQAGANAIKFQTFLPQELVCHDTPKAEYQLLSTGRDESQLEMLKRLALPYEHHESLIRHCAQVRIMFLSSPFDEKSVDFLNNLGMDFFKIPSGEITNYPYLKKIGQLNKKVILSTGMSTIEEIGNALRTLQYWGTVTENMTLLHCTTEYPTPYANVNLRAMSTLMKTFPDIRIGFSDHTLGIEVSIAAVARGAAVIEKHFTLDKALPGPDHKASLSPSELKTLVQSLRNVDLCLGSAEKKPTPGEAKNIISIRKSIVARRNIKNDEVFTEENLTTKRPALGINPMQWTTLMGRRSKKAYIKDEPISSIEID